MKFDELAELYTSMSLRSLGFSLIGIFVPVYLFQYGVSVKDIFLFFIKQWMQNETLLQAIFDSNHLDILYIYYF